MLMILRRKIRALISRGKSTDIMHLSRGLLRPLLGASKALVHITHLLAMEFPFRARSMVTPELFFYQLLFSIQVPITLDCIVLLLSFAHKIIRWFGLIPGFGVRC